MIYPDVLNGVRDTNILYMRACRAYCRRKPHVYQHPSWALSEVDWVGGGSAVVYLGNSNGVYAIYWYDPATDRLHFLSEEEKQRRVREEQERQEVLAIVDAMGQHQAG